MIGHRLTVDSYANESLKEAEHTATGGLQRVVILLIPGFYRQLEPPHLRRLSGKPPPGCGRGRGPIRHLAPRGDESGWDVDLDLSPDWALGQI